MHLLDGGLDPLNRRPKVRWDRESGHVNVGAGAFRSRMPLPIRAGRRRPHPRHWEVLARLVGGVELRDRRFLLHR